jgi:hypothetical protein
VVRGRLRRLDLEAHQRLLQVRRLHDGGRAASECWR